ncbi:diacylglycerol/lipid kinase family protein [Patescibacteria group bacterium]
MPINDTEYFYFYDDFLKDKKYETEIHRIETRLLELGLTGRKERLTVLKNTKEILEDGIKRGAKTVVAIGSDATISKVMSVVADHENIVLGMIPVGPEQNIAEMLGVPTGIAACDILSKRIVKKVDLGKVNDQYFLFSLDIPVERVTVKCDNKYEVSIDDADAEMRICNIGSVTTANKKVKHNDPADGKLEAVIRSRQSSWGIFKKKFDKDSIFKIKKARISSRDGDATLVADGQTMIKTPAKVEIVPKKLQLIVGRDRQF